MVVDTKLYDLLGVSPDADDRTIKKAFMMKAKQLHPDKNRDDPQATEKFQAVNEAYEVLKDPEKRANYDRYGPDSLKGEGPGNANDIFSHIFGDDFGFGFGFPGFGRGGSRKQRTPRTENITYNLNVKLEEFYNGSDRKINLQRQRKCTACNGNGTKNGAAPQKCRKCNGTGNVTNQYRRGNSTVISTSVCPTCNGTGEFIAENDKCPVCKGHKTVSEKKPLTIHISPGMENGEEIVMKGEADEFPGYETGDLIVTLREVKHDLFIRNHENLIMNKEITFAESILGFSFTINTLDGRTLLINREGVITNNADIIKIPDEGMPKDNTGIEKGSLFIQFTVQPIKSQKDIPQPVLDAMRLYMAPEEPQVDTNDPNVFTPKSYPSSLNDFKKHSRKKRTEKRREAYQNDEYDESDDNSNQGCNPM